MMSKQTGIVFTAALLFVVLPLIVSCGKKNKAAGGNGNEKLVLLSPHWEGIQYEFEQGFKKYYKEKTGREIELEWRDVGGGSSDIRRWVHTQFRAKPDGIGVDVMFGGGTEPYLDFDSAGLLAPVHLPDEVFSKIAPDINGIPLYSKDRSWFCATMSGFGILYNKVILKDKGLPEPKEWADLARPEYRGLAGSADPRKSGSMHMAYEIILQAYGWEKGWRIITGFGANAHHFTGGARGVADEVAQGKVALAPAIDFYAWAQISKYGEERLGYVMPENLTVVNGDGIGIFKGAPNTAAAEAFVEFVLSEPGQNLWFLKKGAPGGPVKYELGRFSILSTMYSLPPETVAVKMNPFEWKSGFRYDPIKGGARYEIVNVLVGTQVIQPHAALSAAWKRGVPLEDLGVMPITEAEVKKLSASTEFTDPVRKQEISMQWAAFARKKFD